MTQPTHTHYQITLHLAREEAQRHRHKYIRTEHLLLALLRQPETSTHQQLTTAGLTYDAFAGHVGTLARPVCAADETLELAAGSVRALQTALQLAGDDAPDNGHLLRGILQNSPLSRRILTTMGINVEQLISG